MNWTSAPSNCNSSFLGNRHVAFLSNFAFKICIKKHLSSGAVNVLKRHLCNFFLNRKHLGLSNYKTLGVCGHNLLLWKRSRNCFSCFLWKAKIKLGCDQVKVLVCEGSSSKPNTSWGMVGLWLLQHFSLFPHIIIPCYGSKPCALETF